MSAIRAVYRPPKHLSEHSAGLWRELVPQKVSDVGELEILLLALEARDRIEAARVKLEGEDLVLYTDSTGAAHINPLVKVLASERKAFLALWREVTA